VSLPNVSSWPGPANFLATSIDRHRPILLKNSFAVPELSVREKVDPPERAQSYAN
jgi:hypothetical protein